MNPAKTLAMVEQVWEQSILPALEDYIRIPNQSPAFDAAWQEHGHMARAFKLAEEWCRAQPIPGLRVELVQLEGRTPLLFMELAGETDECVMLYGHLDKQPEMTGWSDGLSPWTPVRRGDRLYGRGGADDGYACFASLTAIRALREQGGKHARLVVVIEGCEESGSYDLPHYMAHLAGRIGKVDLVVCLDSGCGNYDQLWCTTSLRGLLAGDLSIEVLREGVHSGGAGGIVPSTFDVLRQLLDRLTDARTGRVLVDSCHVEIPAQRRQQAVAAAAVLGESIRSAFPFQPGVRPLVGGPADQILARTWRPCVEVVGASGLPAVENAGNVLRPRTTVRLSIRIPPRADPGAAIAAVKQLLEAHPPYGAKVRFDAHSGNAGWDAPPLASWLADSLARASSAYFGAPAMHMGEGGTIPFMAMLGASFPDAQFVITGVLGPQSNAHGPNEFLHVPTAKKLTCVVAQVLVDHLKERGRSSPRGK